VAYIGETSVYNMQGCHPLASNSSRDFCAFMRPGRILEAWVKALKGVKSVKKGLKLEWTGSPHEQFYVE
jgi:hypothetical protein